MSGRRAAGVSLLVLPTRIAMTETVQAMFEAIRIGSSKQHQFVRWFRGEKISIILTHWTP
jgi:hypothetical protein